MKLYPHQERALEETTDYNRVAYYLDMGLGKTFVGSEKLKALNTSVNLIVCQKSKLHDWYEHFKTYYPQYNTVIYDKPRVICDNTVIIINYDLVWRRNELLNLKNFTLMLDESSYIKNESSKRSKFIMKMKPDNVILLSGTPTGGKYEQLYSQLKLLGWKITKQLYWQQFIEFRKQEIGGFVVPIITGYKNVDRLKSKLRQHGAVFMKTEEVFDLPEQIEQVIKTDITKEYKLFKKHRLIEIDGVELVGDTTLTNMLYLRQLAGMYNKDKVSKLRDLLESTEDRVVIFYNFKKEYELICGLCEQLEKPVSTVSGDLKDLSNYENCTNSITLVQYQAGAMGINLQKSNKLLYYSLPLASELFEQSKKRIHRIGQNRTCFYYYLITENSIENDIMDTLKQRRDFTDKLFEEMGG